MAGASVKIEAPDSADISLRGPLSLERAIEIALENHPSLKEAKSNVDSQSARLGQSAAAARPRVSASSSYGYSYSEAGGERGSMNTEFTLQQTIFDWNRTELSIKEARQQLEALLLDENGTEEDVARSVMDAYFSLNRSERAVKIAAERLENYSKRLKWAEDFYHLGAKAKIEVTRAQTDLATAKLDMVSSQGARQKALSNLAYAMGVAMSTPEILEDGLEFVPYDINLSEAIDTAMNNRDDLKAQSVRIEAARTSLALAKKGMSPTLSGSAGYSFTGEIDPFDERGWRVSVGLSIPVTDGGETRERVKQAEANLEGVMARWESMAQNVILQARTSHASLVEARESVEAAYEAERQAYETLNLALGRYQAGVGESLEISDAVDGYARSRLSVLTALYNHKSAEVELKRIMGVITQ
ncbi:MAG: TolC family protein [Synergistaceae bacterium]|nr:TolC family protein [Synergistaceae bacterium]